MKWIKFFFFIFIIFPIIISKIILEEDVISSDIVISEEKKSEEIQHSEKIHLFSATFDKTKGKFFLFELVPKDILNDYNHIFVSFPGDEETIPNYINSDYKTVDKNTTLLIETQNIAPNVNSGKISIECKKSCDFIINYQIITTIPIIDDKSFDLILNSNEEFVLEYEITEPKEINNKLTFLSNSPTDFGIKITYGNKVISPISEFYNGYGLLLNNNHFKDADILTVKLNHYGKGKELVHISNRKLTSDNKILSLGDFHSSITGIDDLDFEVFELPKIEEDQPDKDYNLNFLSYTKNILVTLGNETENQTTFIINSESDVIQFDAKAFSQLKISPLDNSIATTIFQLLDGTDQTINQDIQMPLYRGVPRKAKLRKGQLAYYKLNFYPSYSTKIDMNLRTIQGKAKMYYGICSNYPTCNFSVEQLESLETEKEINGNTLITKNIESNMTEPYSDPQFQTAIVYCLNNEDSLDCEYYITLSNENDKINIIENQKYYDSVGTLNYNYYQFNIYDFKKELNYLYLELYCYSGGSNIYIYSDIDMTKEITVGKFTSFGNKEYLILNSTDLPDQTLNGKYYIKIKGNSNSIFSIYYSTIKKENINSILERNIFPSGEVVMQGLSLNDGVKSYFVQNKEIFKNAPFLLEFNSLNCELSVLLQGESERIEGRKYQFIIDNSKEYYYDEFYELQIKVTSLDIDNTYKDNLCLFTLTSDEYLYNEEIVLNDGVIQKGQLSKMVKNIKYLYPFRQSGETDSISFYFSKNTDNIINLSYGFREEEVIKYKIVENEKRFVFQRSDFYEICKENYDSYCTLNIKLEADSSTSENSIIEFSIFISDKTPYPVYLNKGEVIKSLLQTNQYQYYYLDIGKNQECDIIIDFVEGYGQGVLKIVKKDEIEDDPNYIRRVKLPLYGMPNTYIYDQYSKSFSITNDMTSDCENGCEIYIGIFHSDQRYKEKVNSYSIYSRIHDEIINLPENSLCHGNLKNVEDINIFRTKISKDTYRVLFNLQSENATIYINTGLKVPTKEEYEFILKSNSNSPLIIKSNDSSTFKEQTFTFIVTTEILDGTYNRNYDIKIEVPEIEIDNIGLIDYLHNNPCYFNNETSKCHFILPVDRYNNEDKLYLFIPDNINSLVYTNSIPMEEYDSLSPEEKIKHFPIKPESASNELIVDISERKSQREIKLQEIYLLITVEKNDKFIKDSKATLIIGEFIQPSSTFLRPNTYNFYSLNSIDESKKNINLIAEAKNTYKITFVLLNDGKGIIEQSQVGKSFNLNKDENTILTMMVDPELKSQTIISVKIDELSIDKTNKNIGNELNFYVLFESRTNTINLDEIKFTDINEQRFEYLKNNENNNSFPLNYYQKINEIKDEQFIIEIFDRLPLDTSFLAKMFSIEGYIVNKDFIESIKGQKEIIIPDKFIKIDGLFDAGSLAGRITFLKDNIEEQVSIGNNYFLIMFNNNEEFIHLDYLEIDILKSSFEFININDYSIQSLNKEQNKLLLLVPEMGVKEMAIDFMADVKNTNKYHVTVNQYYDDNNDYSKNSEYLIKTRGTKSGKSIYILYISQYIHYIVFNIIKDSNSINNINKEDTCIIKFRVVNSDPIYYFLNNRAISSDLNNKKLNISFNGVWENESGETHKDFKVEYSIRFYDKQSLGNIISIDSIYINEKSLMEVNKTFIGDETRKKINMEINIKENDKKEQIVHLLAFASYEENKEILSYDSIIITYGQKQNEENRTSEFWFILFAFVGMVILSFGAIFVYLYAKNDIPKNPPPIPNDYSQISGIQRPSDRRFGTTISNTRVTV